MAKKPKFYRGRYYGKFKTIKEVHDFKLLIIDRYKHTPNELRNIKTLHKDLEKQGYKITYDTIRTWLRTSEVKIVRNRPKKSELMVPVSGTVPESVKETMDEFSDYMEKSLLVRHGVFMMMGLDIPNLMVIFFKEGNVVITDNEDKLIALTTQNLNPADFKFLQGAINMAEAQEDWQEFMQAYCKAAGVTYYPI
jgi:hypothetical protein